MRSVLALLPLLAFLHPKATEPPPRANAPAYTSDGRLEYPEHYREWTYLSSGFDMSYTQRAESSDRHSFDNVFANPEAYKGFLDKGAWPDGTMLVLEVRGALQRGSINQNGSFQGGVQGVEVHVKDGARFPGKWAFFGFDGDKPAPMIAKSANCYGCHEAHGAVDTTFVQFYPTLFPVANSKGTIAPAYRKETAARDQK